MDEITKLSKEIETVMNRLAIEPAPHISELAVAWKEFGDRVIGAGQAMQKIAEAYSAQGKKDRADEFANHAVNLSRAADLFGNLTVWYSQLKLQADNDRRDLHGSIAKCQKLAIALAESERRRRELEEQSL